MKLPDAWMSAAESPTVESLGLLTALGLTVWIIAQRHSGSWAKPVVWLVQGGLKAWLNKEVFEPMQAVQQQHAEKLKQQELEIAQLKGEVGALTKALNSHEERIRAGETTDAKVLEVLDQFGVEIVNIRQNQAMTAQNLVEISENIAASNANHDASLIAQGLLAQDIRQVSQNINTLMLNLIKP